MVLVVPPSSEELASYTFTVIWLKVLVNNISEEGLQSGAWVYSFNSLIKHSILMETTLEIQYHY